MPEEIVLPDLKYLSFVETLMTSPEGHSRKIDYYQPRAQIKRYVKEGKDSESIVQFSKTFAVQELLTRKYLEHLQYLDVKKSK